MSSNDHGFSYTRAHNRPLLPWQLHDNCIDQEGVSFDGFVSASYHELWSDYIYLYVSGELCIDEYMFAFKGLFQ